MSGISNLNIVLQQGGSAQDVHALKQQTAEHTQLVASQQEALREAEKSGKVAESEGAERLQGKKEKNREKNKKKQGDNKNKKKKDDGEKELALTGKLLDTVA